MELVKDMEQGKQTEYTKYRTTNIMRMIISNQALYWYIKPTTRNCKCTFLDGSVYYQKMVATDSTWTIKAEENKLYLDEQCTIPAEVTRKQKIQKLKKARLI